MTKTEMLKELIESAKDKLCAGHVYRFDLDSDEELFEHIKDPCARCGGILELIWEMRLKLKGIVLYPTRQSARMSEDGE